VTAAITDEVIELRLFAATQISPFWHKADILIALSNGRFSEIIFSPVVVVVTTVL
jgi:hypothetical protein